MICRPEPASYLTHAGSDFEIARVQLFRFTQPIVERVPPDQRVLIVEALWEAVYADRVLTAEEDSLVRRVAGLLYVSDRERGAARLKVLKRLGIPE